MSKLINYVIGICGLGLIFGSTYICYNKFTGNKPQDVLEVIRGANGEFKVVAINNTKIAAFNAYKVPSFKKHPSHKEAKKHLNKKKHFLLHDKSTKKVKIVKGTLRHKVGDKHLRFKEEKEKNQTRKNLK